jgi:hypothetical protein
MSVTTHTRTALRNTNRSVVTVSSQFFGSFQHGVTVVASIDIATLR